jgi:hypothetical protein
LAFDPDDFYRQEDIALLPMPPHDIQAAYFAGFRNRVTEAMIKHRLITIQAEQFVWEELEEELLRVRMEGGQ